jgi:FkbM family methyltransferase
MSVRSAGKFIARGLSRFVPPSVAESGVHFFEALQGIGTAADFSSHELDVIFNQVHEPAPVIFDAGAHTGNFLQAALKRCPADATIHAFEPASATFRKLHEAFKDRASVQINRSALSSTSGSGILFYDEPGSQLASLSPRASFGTAKTESVRLETIDEYCEKNAITHIHLLKLDVEGHELEALQGAREMLKRKATYRILFEFGGCDIDSRVFFRDLYEFLTRSGMKISRVIPGGRFLPIDEYHERLERFRVTNYFASLTRPY